MADTVTGKIQRKLMAHYLNVTPGETNATYERLGKDLEEFNVELNAQVDTKENILGETSVVLSSYQPSGSVDPYYAEAGTKTFAFIQDLVDNRKVLDDTKTDILEVHLWEGSSGKYIAYKDEVYVEPKSYGGDTTGYQIPFDVHYTNVRTKGKFNESTNTFTADSTTTGA